MAEYKKEGHSSVNLRDIEELQAIYEDYLFMARQYELVFQYKTIDEMSFTQVKNMYPTCKYPWKFVIPWQIEKMNTDEKQEFTDYTKNNIQGDGRKTYVSLQHVRAEENNGEPPFFAIEPYQNITIAMQLPAMIENYTLSFPKEATLKNTEFHIDGRYKATYFGEKTNDKILADCISDEDLVTEITMMIYLGECFRQNDYKDDKKFGRMAVNVYASEVVGRAENNLLELLSSFAEKVQHICHDRYHQRYPLNDLKKAQEDGFLKLSDNFQDYFNIRNFLRHQWDTLEDLDDFSPQKSAQNKRIRSERANSLLKFCDKTLYQRMTLFILAMHQMQQIIGELNPYRLIRDLSESNNKFTERVKAACQQNPNRQIEVEINYQFDDNKYKALNKIFHKKKIFPNVKIVDDFADTDEKFELMRDYEKRSQFLRNCHGLECYVMGFCQRRGLDKNNREAWNYLHNIGLITAQECQTWQDYISLRNDLAHNYFAADLRKRLKAVEDKYLVDFKNISQRIYKANPEASKVRDNVIKYEHNNGENVTVDYTTHNREISKRQITSQDKTPAENKKNSSNETPQRETYRNGIIFETENGKIVSVRLPNKVRINMKSHSIDWGNRTRWYSKSPNFKALQTPRSTVRTDKTLKIKSIFEGAHNISLDNLDNVLIDGRHNLVLDNTGRIKEFHFQNAENKIIKTEFEHGEGDRPDLISFTDGTHVWLSEKEITVIHNRKVLSYNMRKEFAQTYDATQNLQRIINHGKKR